jgi:RNA polymerase-binding protein DksA
MALNPEELTQIREKLAKQRRQGEKKLKFLEESILQKQDPAARDGVYYSQHPAEIGTDANEREKFYRIATSEHRFLYRVDEALRRIDAGEYGQCQNCGADIPFSRLLVVPTARTCVACQEEAERIRFQGW